MSRAVNSSPALPFKGAGAALALVFGVAAMSQVKLQLFERESTIALGEATNRFTIKRVDPAERGAILTSDGIALAEDTGSKELTLDYRRLPGAPAFYIDLAAATGLPAAELAPPGPTTRSRTWSGPIGPESASRIREVQRLWRADGVSLRSRGSRAYPLGEVVSCLVGIQRELAIKGADGKLKAQMVRTGLESSMQDHLQGRDGEEKGLADKNGIMLPLRTTGSRIERLDGENVVTTLDSTLQQIAAKAVRASVEKNKAENGIAIVIDPTTGDIKAMANWPSFDPGAGAQNATVGYNPATMGIFEPGSTFKILTLAKALDAGKATPQSIIGCSGTLQLNSAWRVRCDQHHGSRAHGPVDATKAIAKSCNVAAATWALRVGRDGFIDYMSDLGLLEKSKLGVPKEVTGTYNRNEYAKRLQLAQFGFGQSVSVSPVALAGAYATLANDGIRREPRLIGSIGNRAVPLEAGRRILGSEACRVTRETMEAVIETDAGTGKTLRIPGYRLAGKTGTAQKIGKGQSGYVASFIGFVPARKPQAVVLVMINRPTGPAYYGALVAGPVFRSIAQGIIDRYRIKPDAQAAREEAAKPAAPSIGPAVDVTTEPVAITGRRHRRAG